MPGASLVLGPDKVESTDRAPSDVFAEHALYLANEVGQCDLSLCADNDRPGGEERTKVLLRFQEGEQTIGGTLMVKVAGMPSASKKPSGCN